MYRYFVFYCIPPERDVRWASLTALDDDEMRAKLPRGTQALQFAKRELPVPAELASDA